MTPSIPQALSPSRAATSLAALVALVSLVAAFIGLVWSGAGDGTTFATVRGETVELLGGGLYEHDSLFVGAGNRGTDAVTLVLGVPLIAVLGLLYQRGSLRAALLLLGMFGYFLYVYASYALGTVAYNQLFILYVVLFSASLIGLVLTFASIDSRALTAHFAPGLPRRGPGIFMLISGAVTLVIWLGPLVAALMTGVPPPRLDHYTTKTTEALDLAIITPAALAAGVLILRRTALGYLVAFSLLALEVMLAPLIVAQTVSQVAAGVSYRPGEIVGPIVGFTLLAAIAIAVTVLLLRHISDSPQSLLRDAAGTGGLNRDSGSGGVASPEVTLAATVLPADFPVPQR